VHLGGGAGAGEGAAGNRGWHWEEAVAGASGDLGIPAEILDADNAHPAGNRRRQVTHAGSLGALAEPNHWKEGDRCSADFISSRLPAKTLLQGCQQSASQNGRSSRKVSVLLRLRSLP